jgi:pyruvate/2-oxoglutarate dehydrogenase complex dihydrolipoamide dehydrogenase (E3) component
MTNVLIIGGGLVGVEAAINVVQQGGKATIVEIGQELAKTSYRANKQHLLSLVEQYNIPYFLNSTISNLKRNTAQIQPSGKLIKFNCVALCCGMDSCNFIPTNANTIVIGDAVKPDNVLNAVWTAYRKIRLI